MDVDVAVDGGIVVVGVVVGATVAVVASLVAAVVPVAAAVVISIVAVIGVFLLLFLMTRSNTACFRQMTFLIVKRFIDGFAETNTKLDDQGLQTSCSFIGMFQP